MSKLPVSHQFLDLSDYGRPIAKIIAHSLKETSITPIHVTMSFIVCGLFAIVGILNGYLWTAAILLIFKSILDAADGELARVKKTPSYTGRFFDSNADFVLNFLIFLSLWHVSGCDFILVILAFIGIQLQGTLYNYYYVILRNNFDGDSTSRIFEDEVPVAMKGEKQKNVDILFATYQLFYKNFDKAIFNLDKAAIHWRVFPNWFMTLVSIFGLGFQLLIMSVMLVLGWMDYIIPFFILYSAMIFVLIGIRKLLAR